MGNRDTAELWAYHDGTKHSPESVRRSRHTLDWDTMPRPFKVYPDLSPLPVPRDLVSSRRPALAALADPGSARADTPPLDRTALAHLLQFSAGVIRRKTFPGGEIHFRAAACTGALYHIDVYPVCGALPDLEAGVYHYGPHDLALRRLRSGDHRAAAVAAAADEPAASLAPVLLACTSTFWRNAWKYEARTYRHCFWDLGTVLANLLAVAAALGHPARVLLGFVDQALDRLLDLDGEREVTLALVALGTGALPPPAPAAPKLGLATLPPSAREVDFPAIRRAHAASSLATAQEVAAWRQASPPRPPGPPAPEAIPLPAAVDPTPEPVERVILRRGSTRAFAHAPIRLAALATILRSASRGIPADCLAPDARLGDVYLIAHAVDGLPPGSYVLDHAREALVPLRAGSFRREAGHLALGQALAADAAVLLFWLADLRPILTRFGNRGYRAAQLEAAIEGGKVYLAAYALRLGATGLTFFDDDVTTFFSPHGAGKSVMFLAAVGHPERRRAPG